MAKPTTTTLHPMLTQVFPSSSSDRRYTTTRDLATGASVCECPGWRFKRANQPRACVHTARLARLVAAR